MGHKHTHVRAHTYTQSLHVVFDGTTACRYPVAQSEIESVIRSQHPSTCFVCAGSGFTLKVS